MKKERRSLQEKTQHKDAPYRVATRVLITRNPDNGDLLLDYLQDDKRATQEIISGHTISRVEVEFQLK